LFPSSLAVHLLVHAHLVVVGCVFVWPLAAVDSVAHRPSFAGRLLAVMCTVPFHAVVGLALASSDRAVAPRAYPSLDDQTTAAGLLWGGGELFGLLLAAVVLTQWWRSERRAGARFDRRTPETGALR